MTEKMCFLHDDAIDMKFLCLNNLQNFAANFIVLRSECNVLDRTLNKGQRERERDRERARERRHKK